MFFRACLPCDAPSGIRAGKHGPAHGSSLVLDSLLRRQARCVDVPVAVDDRFRSRTARLQGPAPTQAHARRLGSAITRVSSSSAWSGASGMVVDLSFYAFFQWLLSFTSLATRTSALFGCSWHLAIAAALSISIALVWNFTLNRRLTFNDAHKGSMLRQFFDVRAQQCAGDRAQLLGPAVSSGAVRLLRAAPAGGGGRRNRGGDRHQLFDVALDRLRPASRAQADRPLPARTGSASVSPSRVP